MLYCRQQQKQKFLIFSHRHIGCTFGLYMNMSNEAIYTQTTRVAIIEQSHNFVTFPIFFANQ